MPQELAPYAPAGCFQSDLAVSDDSPPRRIFVSIPQGEPPAGGWPFLFMSDGNACFPGATGVAQVQSPYPEGTNVEPGVLVAIGYPGTASYDFHRRSFDLSPPPKKTLPPATDDGRPVRIGGADELLDFIEGSLLPWIADLAPIDTGRRMLFDHSFGGLFTLHALFTRPHIFTTWIAASPAIFWDDAVILGTEAARRRHDAPPRLLHLSVGEHEGDSFAPFQLDHADAPERLAQKAQTRTVAHAREMVARLAGEGDRVPADIVPYFEVFAGENHMSVLTVALGRAVQIAFSITPAQSWLPGQSGLKERIP
ncbi:alpha/beta hydrolase-fold protein [Breoghania sp.]|uniref:alpha/beta hydrolase n=1 Tax=Breoghania sp. TaxID=2065378 RepID=UPI002632F78F|nr:alpha/beta hydrolase-fold protein [Breoghania sp.]MDJ0930604.1 alpha/beta hydrolase-fold protein [Breoghania sp.]